MAWDIKRYERRRACMRFGPLDEAGGYMLSILRDIADRTCMAGKEIRDVK